MKRAATYRVVTPEQLKQGYVELVAGVPTPRKYLVIRQRDDGNYVVADSVKQLLTAKPRPVWPFKATTL